MTLISNDLPHLYCQPNSVPCFHLLISTSCLLHSASSIAKPLTPLFEKPVYVPSFSPIPPYSLILPLGHTTLPFPQDSTPLFLPRPVPPGATYPQVLPTLQASGPAFPPPKEGGGRRERRGAVLRKVETISH